MLIQGYQTLALGGLIYEIAFEDLAGDPMYFGYLNLVGEWIIQKRSVSAGAYTYAQGLTDLTTNWTNRASLTYASYDKLVVNNR